MENARDRTLSILRRNSLTNKWLINRLAELGIKVDKSEMSSILLGVRQGDKAKAVIKCSEKILNYYEKCFQGFKDEFD